MSVGRTSIKNAPALSLSRPRQQFEQAEARSPQIQRERSSKSGVGLAELLVKRTL